MADTADHSIFFIIVIILLSFAYGFALLCSIAWLTARTWYLIATRRLRQSTSRQSWLAATVQEALRPSHPALAEELKTWAAKLFGGLFGLTFTGLLFAARGSDDVDDALKPFGLLAYPLLPTIGVLLTTAEVVVVSVGFFVAAMCCKIQGGNEGVAEEEVGLRDSARQEEAASRDSLMLERGHSP